FKTSVPPPTLVSPQNNVTKLPFIYKFVWRKSPGATNYVIQAATDSAFKYIYTFAYDIKDTAATMTNFKPSTVYYWRVLASNPEGNSIWSSFRKFTTGIQGPDIPLMISPANNSVKQPWVMKFTWHKAARAASYDIRISDNQNFGGTGYNKLVQTLIDTTYSLRDTLDAFKTYYWSVRAKNDSGLTN
ncbi:MAG: large repetitive protein, partial [Bacteroidota bacterium]|nr:large repetitive protein [Bacteroidota bacterium]